MDAGSGRPAAEIHRWTEGRRAAGSNQDAWSRWGLVQPHGTSITHPPPHADYHHSQAGGGGGGGVENSTGGRTDSLCLVENSGGQVEVRAGSRDAWSRVKLQVSVSSRIPARRAAMLEDGDAPPPGPCPALPGSSDHLVQNPGRFQLLGPTGNI